MWACRAMKRRMMVIATSLLLIVFGLGTLLGLRLGRPRVVRTAEAQIRPSDRRAGTGTSGNSSPCVDIRNAGPLVGTSGCVSGLVLRVYAARTGNTFLDFCQDYRTCPFSSVIFSADKAKFGNLESLQGRRVEIRGDVVSFHGHAEIVIRDPGQVRSAQK